MGVTLGAGTWFSTSTFCLRISGKGPPQARWTLGERIGLKQRISHVLQDRQRCTLSRLDIHVEGMGRGHPSLPQIGSFKTGGCSAAMVALNLATKGSPHPLTWFAYVR